MLRRFNGKGCYSAGRKRSFLPVSTELTLPQPVVSLPFISPKWVPSVGMGTIGWWRRLQTQ